MARYTIILLTSFMLTSCWSSIFEVDTESVKKILNKTKTELESSTVLYVDQSTCFKQAYNSKDENVWNSIRSSLYTLTNEVVLIKGSVLENKKITTPTEISPIFASMGNDIPNADIETVLKKICDNNKQAVLITDFEIFSKTDPNISMDIDPYLKQYLKNWLSKGNSVHFISERYIEKFLHVKICFYVIFSNDNTKEPISKELLKKVNPLVKAGKCTLHKYVENDFEISKASDDITIDGLDNTVEGSINDGFLLLKFDHSINEITAQMAIDNKIKPIIKNIFFKDGTNFEIKKLEVRATNITSQYLALTDKEIEVKKIDISKAFSLDKKKMAQGEISISINENEIYKDGYLNESGGNLLRLDLIIKDSEIRDLNYKDLEWNSLYGTNSGKIATCVSESIKQLLDEVNPAKNNQILFTFFIKLN